LLQGGKFELELSAFQGHARGVFGLEGIGPEEGEETPVFDTMIKFGLFKTGE